MRSLLFGVTLACGVALASAGCGRVSSATGSNTNWLERCDSDADCGPGSQCWCSACTTSCASDGECQGGTCRATGALGCGVPSAGEVCVAACVTDAECLTFGSELHCRGGACLPLTGSSLDGAGGSGTGGSGGSSGTAGGAPLEPQAAKRLGVAINDTCVAAAGTLYCWGDNLYGQAAADPADTTIDAPRAVPGLSDVASVALNGEHACALTAQGDVYCWGLNDAGQIGGASAPDETCPNYVLDRPGHYPCQPTPTRVESVARAVEVAVGDGVSCARLANGTAQCWGQLSAEFAQIVETAVDVVGLDLGASGGCVRSANEAECSGLAGFGDIGEVEDIQLGGAAVSADGFGCALSSIDGVPGSVTCFGDNRLGQCGTGSYDDQGGSIVAVTDTRQITLGDAHACALTNDGQVHCWGKNTMSAAGPAWLASPPCGFDTCEPTPVHVAGLPPVAAIAAGRDRTCALAEDGTLWCWGADSLSLGAPLRVAGPWEANAQACSGSVHNVANARHQYITLTDHECVTDADCVEVPLLLSCDQTCAIASLPRAAAESAALNLAQLEQDYCPLLSEAGCQAPDVSCPASTTRPICDAGYCTRADPERSGCSDQCACSARRAASLSLFQDECEGFDLWPAMAWPCPSCEESAVYVVVMNRGSEPFSGDAVISWDPQEGSLGAGQLPAARGVSLELEPGAISAAIRIPSVAEGAAMVRVTAEGDCNPLDDAGTEASLPSARADCD